MKILQIAALIILLGAGLGFADEAPRLGIIARVPLSFSVQLTLAQNFALEVGVAATGPAIFAAKYSLRSWRVGVLSLVPTIGLGGAVAFLPGDLIAWGAYALMGLELPIAETRFSLLADLVIVLPLPVGAGTFHIGPQLGVRLDF